MSGVVIDIAAESKSAQEQLREINRHLAEIVRNTNLSSKALGGFNTDSLRNVSRVTKDTSNSFKILDKNAGSAFDTISKESKKSGNSLLSLKTIITTVIASFTAYKGISFFNQAADDITRLQNRLKLVEKDYKGIIIAQEALYKISKETSTSIKDSTNIYTNFVKALESRGVQKAVVLNVTKTLQQAAVLSGSSMEALQGAFIQLNQGIASGTLRGEELNSVLEQLPYFGFELQKQLKMNTGALRRFAEEGKLTTDIVLSVLKNMSFTAQKDFENVVFTVEMAFNRLSSSLSYSIGNFNKYLGFSERLANKILTTSKWIETFASDTETLLITLERSFNNLLKKFNAMSAIKLSWKAIVELDIMPWEAWNYYSKVKELKDFQKKFNNEVEDTLNKKDEISIDKKVLSLAGFEINRTKNPLESLSTSFSFVFEAGKALYGILYDISYVARAYVVPNMTFLEKILISTTTSLWATYQRSVSYYYNAIHLLQKASEAINIFLPGKNIERAFINIFRADSFESLTNNIREFNIELKKGRTNDYLAWLSTAFRPTEGFMKNIYNLGRSLGILEYSFYSVYTISFRRFQVGLEIISNSLQMFYNELIAPKIEPIILILSNYVKGFSLTFLKLMQGSFNAKYGEIFANSFISGIKLLTKSLKNLVRNLYYEIVSVVDSSFDSKFLNEIFKTFVSLSEFIFTFFKVIFKEIYTLLSFQSKIIFQELSANIYQSIKSIKAFFSELLNRTTSKIEIDLSFDFDNSIISSIFRSISKLYSEYVKPLIKEIENFSKSIIEYFQNIYDEVIGNSSWTDLMEGIYDKTSILENVSLKIAFFINNIANFFSNLYSIVIPKIESTFKKLNDFILNEALDTFKELARGITTGLLIVFSYLFGGPKLQFLIGSAIIVFFSNIAQNYFPELTKILSEEFSIALGNAISLGINAVLLKLDLLLAELPQITESVLNNFGAIGSAFNLLIPDSALLQGAIAGLAAYMVFAEKGISNVSDLLFGEMNKKTKERSGGMFSFVTDLYNQLYQTITGSQRRASNLIKAQNKKFAYISIGLLATSLFDAISIFEAAFVAIPFAIYALMGKEAGNRLFVSILVDGIWRTLVTSFNILRGLINANFAADSLIAKIFNIQDWINANRNSNRGAIVTFFSNLKKDFRILTFNFKRNIDDYAKGIISFEDLFTLTRRQGKPDIKWQVGTFDFLKNAFVSTRTTVREALSKIIEFSIVSLRGIGTTFKNAWTGIIKSTKWLADGLLDIFKATFDLLSGIIGKKVILISGAIALLFGSLNASAGVLDGSASSMSLLSSMIDSIGKAILYLVPSLLLLKFAINSFKISGYFTGFFSGIFESIRSFSVNLITDRTKALNQLKGAFSTLFATLFRGYGSLITIALGLYGINKLTSETSSNVDSLSGSFLNFASSLGTALASLVAIVGLFKLIKAFRLGRKNYLTDIKDINVGKIMDKYQSGSYKKGLTGALSGIARDAFSGIFLAMPQIIFENISRRRGQGFKPEIAGLRQVQKEFLKLDLIIKSSWASIAAFNSSIIAGFSKYGAFLGTLYALLQAILIPLKAIWSIVSIIPFLSVITTIFEGIFETFKIGGMLIKDAFTSKTFGEALKTTGSILAQVGKTIFSMGRLATGVVGAIAAVLVGLGSMLLSGDSLAQKFQELYDIGRRFLGLQSATAPGRRTEVQNQLAPRRIAGTEVDFSRAIDNVDFAAINSREYGFLINAVNASSETLKRLEEAYYINGQLTADQQKELDSTLKNLEKVLSKQPQGDNTIQGNVNKFYKSVMIPETSIKDYFINILRDIDPERKLTGWIDDFSIGLQSFGKGVLDILEIASDEIKDKASAFATWIYEGKWIPDVRMATGIKAGAILTDQTLEESPSFYSIKNVFDSVKTSVNEFKDFISQYANISSEEDKINAERLKNYMRFLSIYNDKEFKYELSTFIPPNLQEQIDTLTSEVSARYQTMFDLNTTEFVPRDWYYKGGREAFDKQRAEAKKRYEEASKLLFDTLDKAFSEMLKNKDIDTLNKKLSAEAKKLKINFDIDVGDVFEKQQFNKFQRKLLKDIGVEGPSIRRQIKNARTEEDKFLGYARQKQLILEGKAVEDLAKKFETLDGTLESLSSAYEKLNENVYRSILFNNPTGATNLKNYFQEWKIAEKTLEGFINNPELIQEGDLEARLNDVKENYIKFFNELKTVISKDVLILNDIFSELDLPKLSIPTLKFIENKEKENIASTIVLLGEYQQQLKDQTLTEEQRIEISKKSVEVTNLLRNTLLSFELQALNTTESVVSLKDKLEILKNTFGQELPKEVLQSKKALEDWIDISLKLETLKILQEDAVSTGNFDAIANTSQQIIKLEQLLQDLPNNLSEDTLKSKLESFGVSIKTVFSNLSKDTIYNFTSAFDNIDTSSASVEKKLSAANVIIIQLFEKLKNMNLVGVSTIEDMFSSIDVNIENIVDSSEENIQRYKDLWSQMRSLEVAKTIFANRGDIKNMIIIEKGIQRIKDTAARLNQTLDTVKSKFTDLFEVDIIDEVFFTLPEKIQNNLKGAVQYFEDNFESLKKTGETLTKQPISEFFDQYLLYKNKAKYLKFLSDLKKDTINIMTGGAKAAQEQISKVFKDIDTRDVFKLPTGLSQQLAKEISDATKLEEFLLEANLDEASLRKVEEMLIMKKPAEEIFKAFSDILPEFKSPTEKLIESNTALEEAFKVSHEDLSNLHLILNNSNLSLSELSKKLPEFINILATATGKSEQQIQNEIADSQKMYYTGSDLDGLPFGELVNSTKPLNNSIADVSNTISSSMTSSTDRIVNAIQDLQFTIKPPKTTDYVPATKYEKDFDLGIDLGGFATGGYISGPGGPKDDKIPAMLSDGEYVINAKATKKYGPLLNAINSHKVLGFAKGGYVPQRPANMNELVTRIEKMLIELNIEVPNAEEFMLKIMKKESSFFLDAKNAENASGLIQIRESNARALGTTPEEIRAMNLEEQMELNTRFLRMALKDQGNTVKDIKTLSDLYMAIFQPKHVGSPEDTVLFRKGSNAYKGNAPYDTSPKDGKVTKKEATAAVEKMEIKEAIFKKTETKEKESTKVLSTDNQNNELAQKLRTLGNIEQVRFDAAYRTFEAMKEINPLAAIQSSLAKARTSIDFETLLGYNENIRTQLLKFIKELQYSEQARINLMKEGITDPKEYERVEKAVVKSQKELQGFVETLQYLEEAGKSFKTNTLNLFSDTFKELLKGDIDDYGEFWAGKLDALTNNVIDTFVEGFMEPFSKGKGLFYDLGKNISALGMNLSGGLTGTTEKLGESLDFNTISEKVNKVAPELGVTPESLRTFSEKEKTMGSNLCSCFSSMNQGFSKDSSTNPLSAVSYGADNSIVSKDTEESLKNAGTDMAKPVSEGLTSTMEDFGGELASNFKGLTNGIIKIMQGDFTGIIDIVSSVVNVVKSIIELISLGAATGGYISGPGTGTSDSIPAMLSNGEYVINARSTKQFRPLLESINSGSLAKVAKGFATGGFVGATLVATPAYSDISSQKGSSQQVVNINITGDISRQTKAEIYRMIPEITSGVNTVNKSRNYRG